MLARVMPCGIVATAAAAVGFVAPGRSGRAALVDDASEDDRSQVDPAARLQQRLPEVADLLDPRADVVEAEVLDLACPLSISFHVTGVETGARGRGRTE